MRILVTGGAGFIGSNVTRRLIDQGHDVTVFDSLARAGTEKNLAWLQSAARAPTFVRGDIRDAKAVEAVVAGQEIVLHFAAQVAVTTSLADPRHDFDVNALGTLNVLEAARQSSRPPFVLFTSTNKVYGDLADVPLAEGASAYSAPGLPNGVDESRPLDLHSPYGCSKGAADQYVRDYSRIFSVPSAVFRMSCIYGTRQFGNEDQGWLAHFAISFLQGRAVTIYGDGKQVRDALFVSDLARVVEKAIERRDAIDGDVFNIGGGPDNVLSVRELVARLESEFGRKVPVSYAEARPGDQRYYVSDVRKARRVLDWTPEISTKEGLDRLVAWLTENVGLFGGAR